MCEYFCDRGIYGEMVSNAHSFCLWNSAYIYIWLLFGRDFLQTVNVWCRRGAEKAAIELVRPFWGERSYRQFWSCMSRESIKALSPVPAKNCNNSPNKTKQPFYKLLLWISHLSCMVKLIANMLFSFQWMLFSFVLSTFSCLEVFSSQFCPVRTWFP